MTLNAVVGIAIIAAPVVPGRALVPVQTTPEETRPGAVAFEWIKGLLGEWQGTFAWSGGRTGSGEMKATYELTGMGTAVVEHLIIGTSPVMTSVYHLDGPDLRMTHYCGAGNQPRLRANQVDYARRAIGFAFVDVTNLARPTAGHVHSFELQLEEAGGLTLRFTFRGDGSESYELVRLTRVATTGG